MFNLAFLTVKGVFRDKVFQGILMTALVFLVVPSVSSLSMRQPAALSLTLSLSLISFILLLLSVFLGGTSLWKDMERHYTISVMGLPISRTSYVLGKFTGIACFTVLTTVLLGAVGCLAVWRVSVVYPPNFPIVWLNVLLAIFFDAQKYILLIAFAFLFSTVSTSFFLPIFGSISTFFIGSASQEVYEYIHSSAGQSLSPLLGKVVTTLYYVLPNFSAFDLKANAIYGVGLSKAGLAMTFGYFVVYTAIVLTLSSIIFSKREIQ
jgi:ABC-type transport system involved in multi-copper enzyme maturation permease subunit